MFYSLVVAGLGFLLGVVWTKNREKEKEQTEAWEVEVFNDTDYTVYVEIDNEVVTIIGITDEDVD